MNKITLGLFSVLLVVALTSVGFAAPAAAQKAPIKVGHIRSLTGPVAITNAQMVKGFELAMDLADHEIAGRKVEIIVEDDGAKAEVSVEKPESSSRKTRSI